MPLTALMNVGSGKRQSLLFQRWNYRFVVLVYRRCVKNVRLRVEWFYRNWIGGVGHNFGLFDGLDICNNEIAKIEFVLSIRLKF